MLLVVASISDHQASAAVEHWKRRGVDATILTCHDLAQPGWRWSLDGDCELVVGGRRVAARELTGVVTRIACVTGYELPFVTEHDRDYAASEMHAFLLALLTSLPCRVVNPPTPDGLCGPILAQEQWVQLAAGARVAVRPAVRREYAGGRVIDLPYAGDRRVIHVVGERAFGAPSERHERAAVAVAKAAGTGLLRTWFDADAAAPTFVDADTWVDLSDPAVADAVHERLAS
jgi:hypothetical protein